MELSNFPIVTEVHYIMETHEKAWFSYLQVFFRWRKFYIITLFGVFVVACVVSLILPKTYQSTATILPPLSSTGFEALVPQEIKGLFGAFSSETAEANVYIAILKSRNLREKMIEQFDLAEVYKFSDDYKIEELLNTLDNHIDVRFDGENPLEVTVRDREPERTAEMVNFMVNELDQMYQYINNRRAFFNRQFLERRVEETRTTLELYEDSMRIFQEQHNLISLPEQAAATIGVTADLIAELMALDIQIQVLESSVQSDHPQLKTFHEERKGIQDQIDRLTKSSLTDPESDLPLPGLDQLPELSMKYLRLFREVEIQGKLLEFLLPQYEQARIQEIRDTPTVTVLDHGRVPTKRIKPKRKILVLITIFLAFIVCTAFIFVVEFFHRIRRTDQSTYRGLEDMAKTIRKEIPFIKNPKPRY